jgi:dTMP kinase
MLIVFEGIDGSGTTTQAKLLAEYFEKKSSDVLLTAEPTNGSIGKWIRKLLQGDEKISPRALQYLFFADREEHIKNVIEPALIANKIVISDRYYMSTIAYASLSNDEAPCKDLAKYIVKPDITFYIKVDAETAIQRIDSRNNQRDIFETLEKQKIIAKAYDVFFESDHNLPNLIVIDGEKEIDEIHHQITNSITEI